MSRDWRGSMGCIKETAESLDRETKAHPRDLELRSRAATLSEELFDVLQHLGQLKTRSPSPPQPPVERAKKAADEAEKQAKRAEEAARRAEEAAKRAQRAIDPLDKAEAGRTARAEAHEARRAAKRAHEAVDEGEGHRP